MFWLSRGELGPSGRASCNRKDVLATFNYLSTKPIHQARRTNQMVMDEKREQYRELVRRRKQCGLCGGLNVKRLCDVQPDEFRSEDIGPWTEWQGNLNSDLMVVGQEWGGTRNYRDQKGADLDIDDTNENLVILLNSIQITVGVPSQYQQKAHPPEYFLYFTNAILCLRDGNASNSSGNQNVPKIKAFRNCGARFLKQQIDIVKPKVIVTLGLLAYRSVLSFACGLKAKNTMAKAFSAGSVKIGPSTLVPLYHCGSKSRLNRDLALQKEDWQTVRAVLLRVNSNLVKP